VITYDEHGGCYDHMPPPWGAVPPDADAGEFGFGFDRFGVRVPTVLVSPLIAPGTVYRAPAGGTPLDHTSVLKTVEQRWNLPALNARDAAAPGFGDVLTLTTPRTDDVLAGVTVPVSAGPGPAVGTVSHLESIRAELISRRYPAGVTARRRDRYQLDASWTVLIMFAARRPRPPGRAGNAAPFSACLAYLFGLI